MASQDFENAITESLDVTTATILINAVVNLYKTYLGLPHGPLPHLAPLGATELITIGLLYCIHISSLIFFNKL